MTGKNLLVPGISARTAAEHAGRCNATDAATSSKVMPNWRFRWRVPTAAMRCKTRSE